MAEEEEELLGPMDELGEDEEEEEDQEGGSPMIRYLPLIAVVLVLQIILVYVTVTFFLGPSKAPPAAEQEVVEEEAPPPEEALETGELEVATVYEKIESIVVNPAGTEGLRFLSAKIHLGLSSVQVEQTIEGKKLGSKIRDGLINILRVRTIAELDPEYHDALKTQIKDKLNEILVGKDPNAAPAVVEVYFQTFVLQ